MWQGSGQSRQPLQAGICGHAREASGALQWGIVVAQSDLLWSSEDLLYSGGCGGGGACLDGGVAGGGSARSLGPLEGSGGTDQGLDGAGKALGSAIRARRRPEAVSCRLSAD